MTQSKEEIMHNTEKLNKFKMSMKAFANEMATYNV